MSIRTEQIVYHSFYDQRFIIISKPGRKMCGRIKKTLSDIDQSILANAFKGKLVPHNPNDEPTSILLRRIRSREKRNKESRID
jgi:hypothetical protein